MIVKWSRFFILLIVVLVSSVYIPQYYWISFEKRVMSPVVYYSPIIHDFLIGHYSSKQFYYQTPQGKRYSRTQADRLLPFFNYRVLAAKEQMPDTIQGIPIRLEEVRLNNISLRIRPKDLNTPSIPLYPLFEANPPRLMLATPQDFFRITDRMEFIDAASNQILEGKSQKFTQALAKQGFAFPAQNIFGNPTTRKPFDEGYFVVDANNQLFHIKMVNGQPVCRNTHKPDSIHIRYMAIKEQNLKEFYGVVIDRNNKVYFLMYDHYRFQPLPITNYQADEDQLLIFCNLFYRIINVKKSNQLLAFTTDRSYKLLGQYQTSWPDKYHTTAGTVSRYLFPFTLTVKKDTSNFVNFYFSEYRFSALFLNVLLLLLALWIFKRRKQSLSSSWLDIILVLTSGLYGFVAVLLFEPPVE